MFKHFIVCPLNWGLGHATRCVPIINRLLELGQKVTLAADGRSHAFLKQQFPELPLLEAPAYNINYPQSGSMTLAMLLQLPKLGASMKRERDNVISDFIVYGKNTKSEFLKLLPDKTLSPEDIAQRNQKINAVRDAIDELDPIYKEVITLFVLQKLPYDEISQILDVPSGTLRSRVHHGLKILRGIMKRRGIEF